MTHRADSPTTRLLHLWARLPRRLVDLGQYHNIWGPGVRLLRNLTLQQKMRIIVIAVLLPMGYLLMQIAQERADDWRRIDNAAIGVQQTLATSQLQGRALDVTRAAYRAQYFGDRFGLAAAIADETAAFEHFRDTLAPSLLRQPSLAHNLEELVTLREAVAAAARAPHPPVRGPAGPSLVAARRYADALQSTRELQSFTWTPDLALDRQTLMLVDGLVEPWSAITPRLGRILGLVASIYEDPIPAADRDGIRARLIGVRTLIEQSRPALTAAAPLVIEQSAELGPNAVAVRRLLATCDSLLALREDDPASLVVDLDDFRRIGLEALLASRSLEATGLDALSERISTQREALRHSLLNEAVLLTFGLALSLYLLVSTYKVVAGGLRFLCLQVDELGRGNLSIRPVGHGKDEIGNSLTVLGQSAAHMSSLLEAVSQGVSAVSHASRVVATGNAGLAERSTEIRDSIGTATGSTQAFATAMDQCTDAVDRAADHVRAMRTESQRSRRSMTELQEQMRALQGKSREIEQVVNIIEAVTYQTKLLAINASVEAARAGTAGKGFSVVSQEVRALATRSEAATRRIQGIVRASVQGITESNFVTERVGQAMERATKEVEQIDGAVAEIVGLARESRSRAREVLSVTHEVDDAVGANARLVQQLSEASAELRDQGDNLKRSVAHFELG